MKASRDLGCVNLNRLGWKTKSTLAVDEEEFNDVSEGPTSRVFSK